MSVQVKELTKTYGKQNAIDDISFEASKGEVLGFLGPNGAGKSTTMKIITCFIPPTKGQVTVCGHDTETDPIKVRREIGYLPENNPLYKDMYVKEYLGFIAGLHKIRKPKSRVLDMIAMVGLEREQHKLIGALSKGYRQRVGLAQAMLHDPQVLILDEPTSGLDPNQLVEIRSLIKQLGQEKTVIFSTHIMQEVQAICDRVIIINKGKIVANDKIERLQNHLSGNTLITVEFKSPVNIEQLKSIPHILSIQKTRDLTYQITTDSKTDIREKIFQFAVESQNTLLAMQRETFSVEDVFQKLTNN